MDRGKKEKPKRRMQVKTPTRDTDVWGTRVFFPFGARATRRAFVFTWRLIRAC